MNVKKLDAWLLLAPNSLASAVPLLISPFPLNHGEIRQHGRQRLQVTPSSLAIFAFSRFAAAGGGYSRLFSRSQMTLFKSNAALALRVSPHIGQRLHAAVGARVTRVMEAGRRHEARRAPGLAYLAVQLVDLLERQALGLVDQRVHKCGAHEAEAAPDEENLDAQIRVTRFAAAHEVRDGVGNGPVQQPVRRRRHGQRLGAHLEREQLARHDPRHGAPRAGEEEDVDAHKRHQHLVGDGRLRRDAHNRHDELAHAHADGAEEQQRPAAPRLDHVQARKGRHDVDDVGDERRGEGVLDARVVEEVGAVVEDEVDARQLLQRLQAAARQQPLAQRAAHRVGVRGPAEAQLVLVARLDFGQLRRHGRVADVEAAQARQRAGGVGPAAALDEVARRFGQHEHAAEEDDGPSELDGDGDAVGAGVVAVLGRVVDNGRQEQADGDGELVASDNSAADPFRRGLRLVQGD